jgi:hypothetical protein
MTFIPVVAQRPFSGIKTRKKAASHKAFVEMRILWSFQVHENDPFLVGCVGENRTENCPRRRGPAGTSRLSDTACAAERQPADHRGKPGDILALERASDQSRRCRDCHPGRRFRGRLSDGKLFAVSTADGSELWRFDTARTFNTVNKVQAKGGSILAPGPTVAGGMLFIGSGYSTIAGQPGNVLLAFAAG